MVKIMENITGEFTGAAEKGIEVYYNDNIGTFEIHVGDEVIDIYDDGEGIMKVHDFIDEQ